MCWEQMQRCIMLHSIKSPLTAPEYKMWGRDYAERVFGRMVDFLL
jgi:hypothetical protein